MCHVPFWDLLYHFDSVSVYQSEDFEIDVRSIVCNIGTFLVDVLAGTGKLQCRCDSAMQGRNLMWHILR